MTRSRFLTRTGTRTVRTRTRTVRIRTRTVRTRTLCSLGFLIFSFGFPSFPYLTRNFLCGKQVYEGYTSPLGIGFIVFGGGGYKAGHGASPGGFKSGRIPSGLQSKRSDEVTLPWPRVPWRS